MNLLTDARRNLATHFRSVHVAAGQVPETGGLQPSARALAHWLDSYHQAFLAAHEEITDSPLHGLHGRSLTLEGEGLLASTEDIVRLADAALRCGMSTIVAVPVTALAAYGHAVAALREALPGLQYRLDCTGVHPGSSAQALEACRATLLEHARQGGNVTLVGHLAVVRAAGLFDEELFNQTFVTLHARPFPGMRPQHKLHDFSPCRDYIAWFIDAAGDVYPCAGMVGHEVARFGSIHEPFSRLIDALAYSERSIDTLARRGPRIPVEIAVFPADLCALHRRTVHGIASL